jgi:toxin FitB
VTAETVAIDTDVASRMMRGSLPAGVAGVLAGSTLAITFVTAGELMRGAVHARWGERRTAGLTRFISRLLVLPADASVARRWGELTGAALRAGRPLPANDAWIAACCVAYGVPLSTLNTRDFARIGELRLVAAPPDR